MLQDRMLQDRMLQDRMLQDRMLQDRMLQDRMFQDQILQVRVLQDRMLRLRVPRRSTKSVRAPWHFRRRSRRSSCESRATSFRRSPPRRAPTPPPRARRASGRGWRILPAQRSPVPCSGGSRMHGASHCGALPARRSRGSPRRATRPRRRRRARPGEGAPLRRAPLRWGLRRGLRRPSRPQGRWFRETACPSPC